MSYDPKAFTNNLSKSGKVIPVFDDNSKHRKQSNDSKMDIDQGNNNFQKPQPKFNKKEEKSPRMMAVRSKSRVHNPVDLSIYSAAIQKLIVKLTNLNKNQIELYYEHNYQEVLGILGTSYKLGQTNSMLLLSRTKQTLHAFISKISEDMMQLMHQWDSHSKLKVIRVNSILCNSESKILQKLCESLDLKHVSQQFHSLEMMDHIKEYFDNNKNIAVCFILEDIDYYVETTKQVLLYKILDMFGQIKLKFVFIATSMKQDIADSFEKRIKSRFSHRMLLFYEQSMENFSKGVTSIFSDILFEVDDQNTRECYNLLQSIVTSDETMETLQDEFEFGKNYEYLAQMLRITLSSLDQILQQKILSADQDQIQKFEIRQVMTQLFFTQLENFTQLKQNSEPVRILEKMTRAQLIVLITAMKVSDKANIFNFEAVYQKYLAFMKNHKTMLQLSKQVFLKTFLDLADSGFIKSESETELLSVNNKIALGFQKKDLNEMLYLCQGKLELPKLLETWALQKSD
eukprot:403347358